MNFLAHIYLSGDNELVTIGNFMADGIKGKEYERYQPDVKTGVLLHRAIDSYTDVHSTFRKSKSRLFSRYGHYSGVIVDILYDHFLAKNWDTYSKIGLEQYVDEFYDSVERHFELLPLRAQRMVPFMIADNWLLSYSTIDGISRVLDGMNRRTRNRSQMNHAIDELKTFYHDFEHEFTEFFDELIQFSSEQLKALSINQ
ncbi:MAG: DUF479 domain-containing protein [Flavobacteriaceae bacterium]|nr:acyl carrier protein phosphodiesterase [Bacteroidia bacterium]NNK88102.1 DUF479 domain-containing protein [Flavobacteriaceae bacterium]